MGRLLIQGGEPLSGEIRISGAKNAALPLLAATLLTSEEVRLSNLPQLQDVETMLALLSSLGVKVDCCETGAVTVSGEVCHQSAPHQLVKAMRASFLVLGPLLAATGFARVPLPGGCAIGARPVDQHLKGLMAMGADITVQDRQVTASTTAGLRGAHILLDMPTVTGTENILMAATLAKGETVIENAACEPEIIDLANCLIAMGAQISGQGSSRIVVNGVSGLHGTTYPISPDRLESGSYLAAVVATGGQALVLNTNPEALKAVLLKLTEAGAKIRVGDNEIHCDMRGRRPKSVNIQTAPYPGFPTDMQAQFMVLNAIASGTSHITENIFENRFMHIRELQRMGADIVFESISRTLINGVEKLKAAPVVATDIRASFGLVIAALAAEGETSIDEIHHIDRGYERLEEKVQLLGGSIRRISSDYMSNEMAG